MTISKHTSLPKTWRNQIQSNPNKESLTTSAVNILADTTSQKDSTELISLITQEGALFILVKSSADNTLLYSKFQGRPRFNP